jgi:hypothetical protein
MNFPVFSEILRSSGRPVLKNRYKRVRKDFAAFRRFLGEGAERGQEFTTSLQFLD